MLHLAIVNKSTFVLDGDARKMTVACAAQVRLHFAPDWQRLAVGVRYVGGDETQVHGDEWPLVILDNADQAGTLGYHDRMPDGRPYSKVFARTVRENGGDMFGPSGVSVTLSHECLEMLGDAAANVWCQAADGYLYAQEACDAVEADAYPMFVDSGHTAVYVSNYVLPAFFDAGASGPYDRMKRLTAPFQTGSGGYQIRYKDSRVTQVYGAEYAEWRKPGKTHAAARTARRYRCAV